MSAWDYIIIAYAVLATYRLGKVLQELMRYKEHCAELEARLILTTLGKRSDDSLH
jgi:hypothetical protein